MHLLLFWSRFQCFYLYERTFIWLVCAMQGCWCSWKTIKLTYELSSRKKMKLRREYVFIQWRNERKNNFQKTTLFQSTFINSHLLHKIPYAQYQREQMSKPKRFLCIWASRSHCSVENNSVENHRKRGKCAPYEFAAMLCVVTHRAGVV